MQDSLTDEQLQKLENVLAINLHGMEVREECTQLVTSERHWERILKLYIASKRLENCAESTLLAYNRCITLLFQGINKKIHEITTNDLRYYLAIYQERRKISLAYLETLRHNISGFFSWATDEGYINRNPARRLKRVKVPQKIKKPYTAEEREHLKDVAKTERDRFLTTLVSFAVMMTVDHGAAKLCTHFIELVTEVRHLIGTVLITSNDLINRVYNDRYIILLCCPSDQLWCKLIHRYRLSSKVPDINILQVVWDIAKGLIYIFKTVKTARPVKLQVHVHHTSLRTMPLQPLLALCYSDTQFYL